MTDMHSSALGELTYTIGLPGSGKSYWARQQRDITGPRTGRKIFLVSRDDYRSMGFDHLWTGHQEMPPAEREDAVTIAQHASIEALLRAGWDVIVHDTNLRPGHSQRLDLLAHRLSARVHVQDFRDVPLAKCIENDEKRKAAGGHYIGAAVIVYLHQKYILGESYRKYILGET